jgi:hypothetical protein
MVRSAHGSALGTTPVPPSADTDPRWLDSLIDDARRSHDSTTRRLRTAVFLFRVAFTGGEPTDRVLGLAYQVQETYQMLRTIEAALSRLLELRAGRGPRAL